MIIFQDVTIGYPGKVVLEHVHFSLPDKAKIALMGPSGFGKSTLLKTLAGLIPPLSGKVTGLEERKVAFLFQEDRLLPWLSAGKNVEMVADRDAAFQWLERMEIHNPNQMPGTMSGGMQRRVALARALAYRGDLLLLDEPFKGLDAALRERIAERIRDQAPLILLSIHDRKEAELMGAQVMEMEALGKKPQTT